MVKRSDLIVSLATVATTALAGALGPVGLEVARQTVKLAQSLWDNGSPQRHLQITIQQGMETWARGENLDPDTVDRGLGWAVEYVQRAGSTYDLIAEADFDPVRTTRAVLDQVRRSDKYWGTETEYAVAERAVGATYLALCQQLKSEGGVVLAAIQSVRGAILASVDTLRDELVGVADRTDLIRYMESKIREWDFSPWTLGKNPSTLERTLRIDIAGSSSKQMSVGEALEGAWLLVVLGGPGSGKTWLGQRCAREAAQAAMAQLQDPLVDPRTVEVPIFTRWSEWAKQPDDGVDGLATAALPSPRSDRVRRSVMRPGTRVLAVIDSLDEVGTSENTTRNLLHSLVAPPGWQVLVTSRPEAWHSTASALPTSRDVRVGTLVDLEYPQDVHGFIEQWFRDEPAAAQHLIDQIDRRHELRHTAPVPLLLTFYCMLTEQEPDQNLPWRRRDLFRHIVDRLLLGRWSGDAPEPDLEACGKILQAWAWDAVKKATTPVGLGAWPDTITTSSAPKGLEQALDHVAPKQMYPAESKYDHSRVARRFVHRTLLEHCLAEELATFPAEATVDALIPHVWFDPEWAVAAPQAIAAHSQRDTVLRGLWKYHPEPANAIHQVANTQLEDLVLQVAAETLPSDWSPDHQLLINNLRVASASEQPDLIAASRHWTASNHRAAGTLLAALPGADSFTVRDLVAVLLSLDPSDADRAAARDALLAGLPGAHDSADRDLVSLLPLLVVSDADRAAARDTVLAGLPGANPLTVRHLVAVLPLLVVSDADRAAARHAVLAALPGAHPAAVRHLVAGLPSLDPSDADRATARHAVLAALPGAHPAAAVRDLVAGLPSLDPSAADRATARHAVLAALPGADPFTVRHLVAVLPLLVVSDADRATARHAVLAALPGAHHSAVRELVAVLPSLDPSDADRTAARHAVLAALPGAHPFRVHRLVAVLPSLDPSDADRAAARHAVLAALPGADPAAVRDLVAVLPSLDPSDADRAAARHAVLAALPGADPDAVRDLVAGLPSLDPSDADRATARQAALAALPGAHPAAVRHLVAVLPLLVVSDADRAAARHAVLAALPGADPAAVRDLVEVLLSLDPSDADRAAARHAVLAALPGADPFTVRDLVEVLLSLDPSDADRAAARHAVLAALPGADPAAVSDLVETARSCVSPLEWLGLLS
jgi:hypothetical protein